MPGYLRQSTASQSRAIGPFIDDTDFKTTETALTVHLVTPDGAPTDAFIDHVAHELEARFAIHHSTLQLERGTTQHACRLHGAAAGHAHDHP